MQNLYKETKFILEKYNIKANKSLGQNFLIDEETVNSIVDAANISGQDLIIEIGPGLGTLTQRILEKAGKVICIELDPRMIEILEERFALYDNIKIIHEDVLKVNLNELIEKEKKNTNITCAKIVANLPYYITTPIVMKLLEDKLDIESITIMIQKEVAQRLIAEPGDSLSGAITYGIHYYTEPEFVTEVSRNSFIPAPEVDSEVIKLKIKQKQDILVENEERLFKIIKLAFMQRRKTLINALSNGNIFESKEQIENILKDLGIDMRVRGEKLTLEQFAQISNYKINK